MRLHQGNCLDVIKTVETATIDAIMTDLPYGITQAKWDCEIDLDKLWVEYKRVAKPNAAIVLFGSQPFTSKLISSNINWFKYCWYWKKEKGNGFLNARKQPLRSVEEICVFYKKQCTYNPQMIKLDTPQKEYLATTASETTGKVKSFSESPTVKIYTEKCPTNVLEFKRDKANRIHSTQKPLALMEYLVKTYTDVNQVILDTCMGSGTTGVACKNLDRQFVGIELDQTMFDLAAARIHSC